MYTPYYKIKYTSCYIPNVHLLQIVNPITKCNPYYKVCTLLQSANAITKCAPLYKVHTLLQSVNPITKCILPITIYMHPVTKCTLITLILTLITPHNMMA